MLQETGIATRAQEMHLAAALRDKGCTPFFSSRLADTAASSTSRGGGLLTAVSSKYVAEHEVLSFTEIVPGKAAAPGNPHRRGRPHPHQCPRSRGRLLRVGGTGGVLGRHTNVCHGAQPPWEAPGGHRRQQQRLHGCHLQSGHGVLPRGLGGLRFPEGQGRRRGGHDPHAPPVRARGGHLPGQRALSCRGPCRKASGPAAWHSPR